MIYYILAFIFGGSLAILALLKILNTIIKENVLYFNLINLRSDIEHFRDDLQHHDMEEELLRYTTKLIRLTEETIYIKRPLWERPKRFPPWK